jgi:malonate transporter
MSHFIASLWHQILLSMPLFMLAIFGYAIVRIGKWQKSVTDGISLFVFKVALPIMLFRMMTTFSQQPMVDSRLLIAFFGGCLIVFVIGRVVGAKIFKLDGTSGSVFALSGIFSNNVMIGTPIAVLLLGESSLPAVALVLVFNGLILWSLVTISVEWSINGALTLKGFGKTLKGVIKNPIIIGIIGGTLFSLTHLPMPEVVDKPLLMISQIASPLSLIALGMGMAEYKISERWQISAAICLLKLLVQPMIVWGLAVWLGLPVMETQVVVLLGSMAVGVNVYLMARQFNVIIAPVASGLLLSTMLSALTTPLIMTFIGVQLQ